MIGVPVEIIHDPSLKLMGTETGGTVMNSVAINAAAYTGWLFVGNRKQLTLAVDYTNSAGTAVTMTCKTAFDNSGANGTGYELHEITRTGTSAAPVGTSAIYTWSNAVSGDEDWTWLVDNIPLDWINCAFTATSGGANDKVIVKVVGVSP
jgi:hypothetical protein